MSPILVIIVAYNAMPWAERCYRSLRNSIVPCDVITIDNGSTDGTQTFVRTHYPEVMLIENGQNLGFGQANNIGLQRALDEGYPYVYLLNQDAWVQPDTFSQLIRVAEQHPDYGILSPLQMQANGQHLDGNFMEGPICSGQKYFPSLIEDALFSQLQELYQVNFVMAAHWLITRACLLKVGGFSPTFPHYGEDDNYADRVRFMGLKMGIVTTAMAVHDRANRATSQEKRAYIEHYIYALRALSNPLGRCSMRRYLKNQMISALCNRDKAALSYAFRIWKERGQIESNFAKSLGDCAFLS